MQKLSVSQVVEMVGGTLLCGDPGTEILGLASLEDAIPGDLSFFSDHRYAARLQKTRASAVLVPPGLAAAELPVKVACIGVEDPSRAFTTVVDAFGIQPIPFTPGVHPSAVVAESAKYDLAKVCIGANAVIDAEVELGDGVEIGPGCYVGRGVVIGQGSRMAANSTVHLGCSLGERVTLHSGVVVGADGFGYEFQGGVHKKVRQSGVVQIDNDVEVGAGTTIDRARFGRTWIGEGTKIDNLVQIGHNVTVGRHCIIVACAAIAGSAVIGDYVVVAAQAGIAGHVSVGRGSTLGARAGVTKNLAPGGSYMGFPAREAKEERRRLAMTNRLPEMLAKLKDLASRVEELEAQRGSNGTAKA